MVLLDYKLLGASGLDTFKEMLALDMNVPTIFVSGSTDTLVAVEALKLGVQDYLVKDINGEYLNLLPQVVLKARQQWEEKEKRKKIEAKLAEARRREMSVGEKIQQTLLLGCPPKTLVGLQVAARTAASQRIAGDFYDFFKHSDRCFDLLIGDVMGKGIAAALLGAATKAQFSRATSYLLSSSRHLPEPSAIVQLVQNSMTAQLIGLETFVTLCYARFDFDHRRTSLVDCGHMKTIHFHQATQECTKLASLDLPLGVSEREAYENISAEFEPGDLFFFYSDGVTDARAADGEFFGVDSLTEYIRANAHLAPEDLIEQVCRTITGFTGSEPLADDVTCVAVKIKEPSVEEAAAEASAALEMSSDLANLARVRDFVRAFCMQDAQPPLDEDDTHQLELAVDEAVSNITKHAYMGQPDQRIQIQAEAFPDRIVISMKHWGRSFDPDSVPPPSLDGRREDGYGSDLMADCVDEVSYPEDENGMRSTRLVKRRQRQKDK